MFIMAAAIFLSVALLPGAASAQAKSSKGAGYEQLNLFGEALEEVTPGIATYLSATEGHEAHLAALIERLSGYLETGAGAGLGVGRPPEAGRSPGNGTGKRAGSA